MNEISPKRHCAEVESNDSLSSAGYSHTPPRFSERLTQIVSEDINIQDLNKTSNTAEAGIIEKIELRNFMCHQRLSINFSPQVNFIVGRNGSGKSAVLTALTLCLGGSARQTDRGTNLKSFLTAGATSGKIIIKLRNCGSDAYQHTIFGNSIIIERSIRADGSTSYHIRNASEKEISNKRSELQQILDHFMIQPENPIQILNQDMSRQFLQSKDDKDKYQFFMKATQLFNLTCDYQRLSESLQRLESDLLLHKKNMEREKRKVYEAERLYKGLTETKTSLTKLSDMKAQLAWKVVDEFEKDLIKINEIVGQCREGKASVERELQEVEAKLNDINAEEQEVNDSLEMLCENLRALRKEMSSYKQKHKEVCELKRLRKEELNETKSSISQYKEIKNQIIKKVNEIKECEDLDINKEIRSREGSIEDLKKSLGQTVEVISEWDKQKQELLEKTNHLQSQADKLDEEIHVAAKDVNHAETDYSNAIMKKSNNIQIWGRDQPEVLKEIEGSQHLFKRQPIGPLGHYITVKDIKWAAALEACCGKIMSSYVVNDHEDAAVLRGIFRRLRGSYTVIVRKYQDRVYDVSRHRASFRSASPTIFDVIESSHPVVMNALIDQCSIEQVVLFENFRNALEEMGSISKARKGYDRKGDCYILSAHGGSFVSNTNRYQPRFQEVNSEKIAYFTEQRRKKKQLLLTLQQQREQTKNELNSLQQKLKELQTLLHQKIGKREAFIRDIELLQAEINDLSEPRTDAKIYHTQIQLENEKIQKAEEVLRERDTNYNEVLKVSEKLLKASENTKNKYEEVQMQHETNEKKLNELLTEKQMHQSLLKELQIKIKKFESTTKSVERDQQNLENELKTLISNASALSEIRVTSDESRQELESKVKSLELHIAETTCRQGSPAELTENYYNAVARYKDVRLGVKNISSYKKKLTRELKTRACQFMDFRKFLTFRASHYFRVGFVGDLLIDHATNVLSLKVRPNNTREGEGKGDSDSLELRNTNTLSGGERSFSTLCFVLALWESMECPFRCMDEFDVFMDMINRRISLDALISMARAQKNRQFIFITPQEISGFASGPDVRIHKLRDPDRSQTVLDF